MISYEVKCIGAKYLQLFVLSELSTYYSYTKIWGICTKSPLNESTTNTDLHSFYNYNNHMEVHMH